MTDYDYNNLPQELSAEPLPDELFPAAVAAITEALESDSTLAMEARAVHVYDRKGYMNDDSFIGHQNPAYRNPTDDVVLQLTVRIPNPKTVRGGLDATARLEELAEKYDRRAEEARLNAELAQAEADAQKAENAAREAREKLEALKNKQKR